MSSIPRQIAQLGIIVAVLVIFADAFFVSYPTLQWLALGVIFFIVATWTLALLIRETIPSRRKLSSTEHDDDELETLEGVIHAALNGSQPGGAEILSERIRSIALSSLASALDRPDAEIRALAQNRPEELRRMIEDRDLRNFVVNAEPSQLGTFYSIESLLGKLEAMLV